MAGRFTASCFCWSALCKLSTQFERIRGTFAETEEWHCFRLWEKLCDCADRQEVVSQMWLMHTGWWSALYHRELWWCAGRTGLTEVSSRAAFISLIQLLLDKRSKSETVFYGDLFRNRWEIFSSMCVSMSMCMCGCSLVSSEILANLNLNLKRVPQLCCFCFKVCRWVNSHLTCQYNS